MLGFKRFRTAAITIAGIESLCRIYKGNGILQATPQRQRYARRLECSAGGGETGPVEGLEGLRRSGLYLHQNLGKSVW